jgi:glycerol-3-phosphate dehydrogenase (NAD(P)+)
MNVAQLTRRITVAGAGSWGTTVAHLLAGKGFNVTLWAREPELVEQIRRTSQNDRYLKGVTLHPGLKTHGDLKESLSDADLAVFAIPAQSRKPGERPRGGQRGALF